MRPRYVITVDVAAARAGEPAVRVEELATGRTSVHRRVVLGEFSTVVSGEPRRNGAVVWVETNDVIAD